MPEVTNELLIGLGGLVLSVLTYFAGVWRANRRHALEDSEERVKRVCDRYMEFRHSGRTAGLDGLQKAGAAMLLSMDEYRELFALIVAHGEKHPMGTDWEDQFNGVDLVRFFRYAAEKQINFFQTKIEDVIRDSESRK